MNPEAITVLESLEQGVLMLDGDFCIAVANAAFLRIVGRDSENLKGMPLVKVIPGFNQPFYRHIFIDTLYEGRSYFLSAAIHRELLDCQGKYNIRVSQVDVPRKLLLLEFVDVTPEFVRIHALKEKMETLNRINRDLVEREKSIRSLAYYDSLTGVANRAFFMELSGKLLHAAERSREMLGLMFIDVDRFKSINDTYGHASGDGVLCHVAKVLTGSTRKTDVVARYGGDEFLVLLSKLKAKQDSLAVAEKIYQSNRVSTPDSPRPVSFSIGISFFPQDGSRVDDLIQKADRAMYAAKHSGGRCRVCTSDQLAVTS